MDDKAADFSIRAGQADAQAEKVRDPALKDAYREMAKQWRELARQAAELKR